MDHACECDQEIAFMHSDCAHGGSVPIRETLTQGERALSIGRNIPSTQLLRYESRFE